MYDYRSLLQNIVSFIELFGNFFGPLKSLATEYLLNVPFHITVDLTVEKSASAAEARPPPSPTSKNSQKSTCYYISDAT